MKNKFFTLLLLISIGQSCRSVTVYESGPAPAFQSFEEYYKKKLEKSKELKARPGNEEKLIRISPGKTPIAILYIHGFGASRAEGEDVVDKLSEKFKANTYYLRLPGHGTNEEDHRSQKYTDLLEEARIALLMTKQLGDNVVVVGTSMGGLIATHLAANYPKDVNALILASPFYDFDARLSRIANFYGGMTLINLAFGKMRDTSYKTRKPENKVGTSPDYDLYWYTNQYYDALDYLNELRRAVATDDSYSAVTSPVLMFYYYKNEKKKDTAASVSAMIDAFHKFPSTTMKASKNRIVNVLEGEHIMLSKYIETNKDYILLESEDFLKNIFLKKKE